MSKIIRIHPDNDKSFNNVTANESILDVWKKTYKEKRHLGSDVKITRLYTMGYFWFICFIELYCALVEIIPYFYSDFGPEYIYFAKLFCIFCFLNALANWLLTVFTKTYVKNDNDRPDTIEKAWAVYDKLPNEIKAQTGNRQDNISISLGVLDKSELEWKFCKICNVPSPPRSHHCRICQKCILKRDHHCFLVGTCIGFYNQRFFIILTFYVAVASFGGLVHIAVYMKNEFYPNHSLFSWFLPITILKCIFGDFHYKYILLMFQMYTFWWSGPLCLGFFLYQIFMMYSGQTAFEMMKSTKSRSYHSINSPRDNIQSIFGGFWLLNFLFPAHLIFRQIGDGRNWTGIKIKHDIEV